MSEPFENYIVDKPLFPLGQLVATPGGAEALANNGSPIVQILQRHVSGDWGDLDEEDKRANDRAVTEGTRIFSAYHLADGTKVWCITEADRSATTILLPEEY